MDPLEAAKQLYGALLPQPLTITGTLEELEAALGAGERNVLVELPWGEVHGGRRHDRHLVVVKRIADGRVYFANGLKNPDPVGAVIEGPDRGPARRVEPNHEESMPKAAFEALFARGGKAMVTDSDR